MAQKPQYTEILLLNDKIDQVEAKIDTRFDKVESQLDKYNLLLAEHIAGVQLAREENKLLKEYIEKETETITAKIEPIDEHVTMVKGFIKYAGAIIGLLATIVAIYEGLNAIL